jgi:hypothetical protein
MQIAKEVLEDTKKATSAMLNKQDEALTFLLMCFEVGLCV